MGEPTKVLIVDDNEGIRTALSVLLDVHDIPHLAVSRPTAALEAIRTFDLRTEIIHCHDWTSGLIPAVPSCVCA